MKLPPSFSHFSFFSPSHFNLPSLLSSIPNSYTLPSPLPPLPPSSLSIFPYFPSNTILPYKPISPFFLPSLTFLKSFSPIIHYLSPLSHPLSLPGSTRWNIGWTHP